jgi:hypothetical protein
MGETAPQPFHFIYLSHPLSIYATAASGKTPGMSFGITGNALYAATAKCGTHGRVFYARGCAHTGARVGYAVVRARVLARARVENLIQNAAERGLILCAYPYGGVRAENTRFYTIRQDKRAARIT